MQRGLRAQLRSGSLLTGQLYVATDFFPDAASVNFDARAEPLELPTVPSDLEELHQQVQAILRKVNLIPFETLGQDAHRLMVSLNASAKRIDLLTQHADDAMLPEIRDSLRDMRRTMEATQASLAEDSPLQQDTRQLSVSAWPRPHGR